MEKLDIISNIKSVIKNTKFIRIKKESTKGNVMMYVTTQVSRKVLF